MTSATPNAITTSFEFPKSALVRNCCSTDPRLTANENDEHTVTYSETYTTRAYPRKRIKQLGTLLAVARPLRPWLRNWSLSLPSVSTHG